MVLISYEMISYLSHLKLFLHSPNHPNIFRNTSTASSKSHRKIMHPSTIKSRPRAHKPPHGLYPQSCSDNTPRQRLSNRACETKHKYPRNSGRDTNRIDRKGGIFGICIAFEKLATQ